jgi:tetraacyldisaccharide-1-P 4'-kinase
MMAKSFPGSIAVARRRIDAARLLSARGHFEVIILDDGFQHLRLRRDLNLLLISAARGFGNGWVLPAGPLRERRHAINRADAIVLIDAGGEPAITPPSNATVSQAAVAPLSDVNVAQPAVAATDALALPDHIPIIRAAIRPRALVHADAAGWHETPLALAGRRVVAVSGVADPASFHAMLTRLGATLVATLDYPDHHDYTPHDLENILCAARNADQIVTTEKDLVKLERFPMANVSIYALRLEVSMVADDETRVFDLIAARTHRGQAYRDQDANAG